MTLTVMIEWCSGFLISLLFFSSSGSLAFLVPRPGRLFGSTGRTERLVDLEIDGYYSGTLLITRSVLHSVYNGLK